MVLAPCSSSLPKLLLKPGRWTVGSAATCSYRIAADGVRPRHALVLCGGQATVLKAWDSQTWHNGLPVSGEVRLQPGDHVTLGSVEFSIELEDDEIDVAALLQDLPIAEDQHDTAANGSDLDSSDHSFARGANFETASSETSDAQSDGWELQRLREQIQELRDEMSQRVLRRSGAVAVVSTPIVPQIQVDESSSARIAELERSVAEAQTLAEQTQQELAATRAEQEQREAELRQVAEDLQPALDVAREDAVELRRELDQLRLEAAQREQAWEQQTAAWSAEREQWQQQLVSSSNARQQLAAEWEQRQTTSLDEATHWKTECEQLRAAWQLQQAAWDNERSQTQVDLRRHEETAQQAVQAVTRLEQELAEQSQRSLSERESIEVVRQQLETEQRERGESIAAVAEERRHVEQHAAEVSAKIEDFARRTAEFEQQQANLAREQQTLEHSWTWLQSDRRKLVEEKEEWQQQQAQWQAECERWIAESEKFQQEREEFAKARDLWQEQHVAAEQLTAESGQLATQWKQLHDEQSVWTAQREQFGTEHRIATDELVAAHEELRLQQQTLRDEQVRLESLRTELEARSIEIERMSQVVNTVGSTTSNAPAKREVEDPTWSNEASSDTAGDWKVAASSTPLPKSSDAVPTEVLLSPQMDAWSIGVDLTAPRETQTIVRNVEPESLSEWALSDDACPTEDATPLATNNDDPAQPDAPEATALESTLIPSDSAPPSSEVSSTPDATLDVTASVSEDEVATPAPSTGPVVSILESMAFAEDEDVDESVSRYMQHLLARSPTDRDGGRDRYIPVSAVKKSNVDAELATKPFSKTATAGEPTPIEPVVVSEIPADVSQPAFNAQPQADETLSRLKPAHLQDRVAIRTATEQMRQVANQQTVSNVEASNWKQIRRSIKTKLLLAALSFLLSAGLLYWGYYYRPEFLILGLFASSLGIVTWLDLLLAIRQAHVRASQLTGRKKPTGQAKS